MKIRGWLVVWAGLVAGSLAWGQSARSGIGAIPYADAGGTGVTFRTWAPNATSVGVRGSFNSWGTTALVKDTPGGNWNGYWSVDVPKAKAGDQYKFKINSTDKKDPRALRQVNSAGNSIVYDQKAFDWGGAANFNAIWRNDLVIYEMHVGTFNAESWLPSTFDQCIEKIPHLKKLGVSAVQLMPVMEFPGDRSWGYNASDPYAVESSFGGPDGLKRFVKACHENGIAVLMDVVHNHYGPSDLDLWQYDGWSQNGKGGIYFYNDWRADTDWGATRPDYGRAEVRDYIHGQIKMLVEDFKIDGFRWDSVYNIIYAGGSDNAQGIQTLNEVNTWLANNHPDVFRIAEDNAFDRTVNFEAEWDRYHFLTDIRGMMTTGSDSARDMSALAYHLSNGGFNRVIYMDSHDTCGDLNNKHRLAYDIDSSNADSYWAKKRALLGNMIALVSPGIPMIFAGSEMHEWYTFSNDQSLRWGRTNTYAGIVQAYSDLIHLRRNLHGVTAGLKQVGKANVHHVNNADKVVGVVRWDQGGQTDDLVLVINASATARTGYSMPFPSAGTWYCLFNSDQTAYDASFGGVGPAVNGTITASGGTPAANLNLGAYSLQIYSKTPLPQDSAASFDPPNPSGCGSTLRITYSSGDGALSNAASVYAYIGRNNWQNPSNHPMVKSNGNWVLNYEIPELTFEVNLSFTDGGSKWDNNDGLNWSVPVANCGDLPATVNWTPQAPNGCVPVTITYKPNGGPLMNATSIYFHVGHNGWRDVGEQALVKYADNDWRLTYAIPEDTWQLDFVFKDGVGDQGRVWDNNDGKDWHVTVQNCLRLDEPFITITNPAPLTAVSNAVTNIQLRGAAGFLTGRLTWSNQLNSLTGSVAYATNWAISSVPLAEGVNVIRVTGTNSSVNLNNGAWDSPTNSIYTALAPTWTSGANGGQKFKAWEITGDGSGFLAVSNPYCQTGPYAWGLRAQDGKFVQAIRPFSAPLVPGDKLTFFFENGGVDGGLGNSSVGFSFENRFNQRLTQVLFDGGTTNYVIYGSERINTGIPWGNIPRSCIFELLTEQTYQITIGDQQFTGEFAEQSEQLVSRIRFWNWNAGSTDERAVFIGALSITGAPLPVVTYAAEVAVTRTPTALREATSLVVSNGQIIVTVNQANGLHNNIWWADTLLTNRWNWSLLPMEEYQINGQTITFTPAPAVLFRLYSFGKPQGQ
ncbi:MAG TPA: carbohydrate-binding protein [Kiritimatiellia bacterium]|jgi:1,4-alpha-glucan branching enzyme|nr:MAG: 1,4-alpha-glucan branching enzyme GlgB [Verrucomicrobia bacterium ADurb.Bin018]HOE00127.1 carbohydrate-binding protein [Kiritimatiellia bacterium]HOE37428.1 carbohydrate-binding protein [Kiritimatiellia bacterium]HOR74851.1 carbohydrate-binding protein [Kiritimatiellia bacterium]HOU58894.1 carbohydrate-binding protein [Kiritimatiellia bacterium]